MNNDNYTTNFEQLKTKGINNDIDKPLLTVSGVKHRTYTVTDTDVTLYDYDSGSTIFLAITGNDDVTITLPSLYNATKEKTGMHFTFINALTPSGTGDAIIVSSGGADDIVVQSSGATSSHARAIINITDYTELNNGDKVNLIATDGTNYDFTVGSQSSAAGTWEATTSNNATATNLMNCINTSNGPSGTRFSATVDTSVVTITQNQEGGDGNTTVTLTDSGTAGMSLTSSFTGGAGGEYNLLADNIKVEAASLGGEWIEMIADDSYWYAKITNVTAASVSMNG